VTYMVSEYFTQVYFNKRLDKVYSVLILSSKTYDWNKNLCEMLFVILLFKKIIKICTQCNRSRGQQYSRQETLAQANPALPAVAV